VAPGTLTDDSAAIQAAIDAVAASRTDNLHTVFIPDRCYVSSTILFKNYMRIKSTGTNQGFGGIFCAAGMDDDCVRSEVSGSPDWHAINVEDMNIVKVRACPDTTTCNSGVTCSCNTSTDTLGSGIDMVDYPAEAAVFRNLYIRGFPQFGINVGAGVGGSGVNFDRIVLHENGIAPALTGTATGTQSSTTLVDTGAPFGADDTKIGWWVRTSDGNTREVDDSTSTTLTVSPAWGVTPTTAVTTYSLDWGGGMVIETGATGVHHLNISNIGGDDNQPALIIISGGSGGNHSGGVGVEIHNVKSEDGANGGQINALRFINTGINTLLSGASHKQGADGPMVYWEGIGTPTHFQYQNINPRAEASATQILLDSTGVDTAANRIQIGPGATPVSYSHEGSFPSRILVELMGAPPFTCSAHWKGNEYYNTDIDEKCICNGSAWKPVSDPAGTTCT